MKKSDDEADRTSEFAQTIGLSGFIRVSTDYERKTTGARFQPIEVPPMTEETE